MGVQSVPEMKRIGVADVVMSQTSDRRAMNRLRVILGAVSLNPSTELFSATFKSGASFAAMSCSSEAMMMDVWWETGKGNWDTINRRMHGLLYYVEVERECLVSLRGGG